jgi:hypothetical protein
VDTVVVTGAGYYTGAICGALARRIKEPCADAKEAARIMQAKGYLKEHPKNWGRFDPLSLATYAAAGWACVDAYLSFAQGKQNLGVIGTSNDGVLHSNLAFFKDYVDAGRNGARSNLFVYTLPTTALAEAALFCGFTGPVVYLHQGSGGAGKLIEEAAMLVRDNSAQGMLAVYADPGGAVCLVLRKGVTGGICPARHLQQCVEGLITVQDILGELDNLIQHEGAH